LKALLARERARAEFQDWEKKEEEVNILKPDEHYSICKKGVPSVESIPHCAGSGEGY